MEIVLKDCHLIVHRNGTIEKIDRRNNKIIPTIVTKNKYGFLCIRIDYKKVPIHKIIAKVYLGYTAGVAPLAILEGDLMEIVHINHNKEDNCVENLLSVSCL
jgi:hypothetical protein